MAAATSTGYKPPSRSGPPASYYIPPAPPRSSSNPPAGSASPDHAPSPKRPVLSLPSSSLSTVAPHAPPSLPAAPFLHGSETAGPARSHWATRSTQTAPPSTGASENEAAPKAPAPAPASRGQ